MLRPPSRPRQGPGTDRIPSGRRSAPRPAPRRPTKRRGARTKRRAGGEHVVDQHARARGRGRRRARAAGRPRRSARGRPTWRRPCERRRHLDTASPVWVASARRDLLGGIEPSPPPAPRRGRAPGRSPRRAARQGRARRSRGRVAGKGRRAPNLSAAHELPRGALVRRRRPGLVEPRDRRQPAAEAGRAATRSARTAAPGPSSPRPHSAQRGGATRPSSSASIRGDRARSASHAWRANSANRHVKRQRYEAAAGAPIEQRSGCRERPERASRCLGGRAVVESPSRRRGQAHDHRDVDDDGTQGVPQVLTGPDSAAKGRCEMRSAGGAPAAAIRTRPARRPDLRLAADHRRRLAERRVRVLEPVAR